MLQCLKLKLPLESKLQEFFARRIFVRQVRIHLDFWWECFWNTYTNTRMSTLPSYSRFLSMNAKKRRIGVLREKRKIYSESNIWNFFSPMCKPSPNKEFTWTKNASEIYFMLISKMKYKVQEPRFKTTNYNIILFQRCSAFDASIRP